MGVSDGFWTVVAAFIGGIISFVGLILAKESKVSDFRQAWIDNLRIDVAAVVAHSNAIYNRIVVFKQLSPENSNILDFWSDLRADTVELNTAVARIKLRLNPREKQSNDVLKILDEIQALFSKDKVRNLDFTETTKICDNLLLATNLVLKDEWYKVKIGEPAYKYTKRFVFIFVFWSGILSLYYISSEVPVLIHN